MVKGSLNTHGAWAADRSGARVGKAVAAKGYDGGWGGGGGDNVVSPQCVVVLVVVVVVLWPRVVIPL